MNRRDYVDLAAALKAVREQCIKNYANGAYVCDRNAHAVANVCTRDPRFDMERFLKNAGVGS